MASIRYLDRHADPARRTISTSGLQGGPPGGDGWTVVATLPAARAGSGQLCFWVNARISNIVPFGTLPSGATGVLQLALGTASGARSSTHIFEVSVLQVLGHAEGLQVTFLVFCAGFAPDPTFGAPWTGATELQLHGRLWWASDSPTYGVQWDVSDVEWVWCSLDSIPSGDIHVQIDEGPWVLNPTIPTHRFPGDPWMGIDQAWLHMAAVYYRPHLTLSGGNPGIRFQWGERALIGVPASVPGVPVVGTAPSVGLGVPWHGLGSSRRRAMGALWWSQQENEERSVGASIYGEGIVDSIRILSIRLDNLPVFLLNKATQIDDFTEWAGQALATERYARVEVAAQGLSWEPMVFASAIVAHPTGTQRRSHSLHLSSEFAEVFQAYQAAVTSQDWQFLFSNPWNVQHLLTAQNPVGPGDPAFEYRLRCLKSLVAGFGAHHPVRDLFIAVFHPLRNPDGQAPIIGAVGAPLEIDPGREAPSPESLPQPPVSHNARVTESPIDTRESLVGSTGYRRTWSTWLRARRTFQVAWSPVSRADADAIDAFVRGASLWRMVPPFGDPIAVTAISEPEIVQVSGPTFSVAVDVVEMVWTS